MLEIIWSKCREIDEQNTYGKCEQFLESWGNLREKGYEIISVPGRYNGGYNLRKTSKECCLAWINKIRVNRFGLPGNYSF